MFYQPAYIPANLQLGDIIAMEIHAEIIRIPAGYFVDKKWGHPRFFCCLQAAYDSLIDEGYVMM
jgi:hypothetical protein